MGDFVEFFDYMEGDQKAKTDFWTNSTKPMFVDTDFAHSFNLYIYAISANDFVIVAFQCFYYDCKLAQQI